MLLIDSDVSVSLLAKLFIFVLLCLLCLGHTTDNFSRAQNQNVTLKNIAESNIEKEENYSTDFLASKTGYGSFDMSVEVLKAGLSGIVSGFAAFSGIYFGNRALDSYRNPRLVLDGQRAITSTGINLFVRDDNSQRIHGDELGFMIPYSVNRLTIRNNGRNAAENCKGSLRIGDFFEKICWSVPAERYTLTLNANSSEFLDVCAIRNDSLALFNEANSLTWNQLPFLEFMNEQPQLIAPTEHGWEPIRIIRPGPTEVLVTGKNCDPMTLNIDITSQVKNGICIVIRN